MIDTDQLLSPEEFRRGIAQLFGAFQSGDLRLLLSKFEPLKPAQKINVLLTVLEVTQHAAILQGRAELADQILKGESSATFEDHRVHIGAIASHAKRLYGLLSQEPFLSALLYDPSNAEAPSKQQWLRVIFSPDCNEAHRLLDSLALVSTWAGLLHANPEILRELRSALAGTQKDNRKSFERAWLWEPIFALWVSCGKHLGASRSGKLHDVIKILHKTLKLEEPNSETVYRAIRDFKKAEGK